MPKIDDYEREVLGAFDKDRLKSVASKTEPEKFKAATRATAILRTAGSTSGCPPAT